MALRLHEGEGDHVHEIALGRRGELVEYIWKVENVELTTVGIDIGSSTSHLMFSGVRLQRKTQALSSQFVVVERNVLWKSPILLTPFADDGTIDAQALGDFIARSYRHAGIDPQAIDTGAVILTGEAIKRRNARAIADLFAVDAGRFVCASAGHHLECALAAHGSGAVALSRELDAAVLNVDIGGGTTKLALADSGRIVSTAAFAVGGRLIAFGADGALARVDEPARIAADFLDVRLPLNVDRIVDAFAEVILDMIAGRVTELGMRLLLTEPLEAGAAIPRALTFSGGVSEYIYGRETRYFSDIAPLVAARIRQAIDAGRIPIPVRAPREGIRATVIGASQFTVQVSGKTIHIGDAASLPLRNVPVVAPALELHGDVDAGHVAAAIRAALERAPVEEEHAIALALRWRGEPLYARLRALAEGIALALVTGERASAPLVLMIDGDVGRTLGHILEHELAVGRDVVSIDGIQLAEFDFVDIGEPIRPAEVVPVVIKSLLFSGAPTAAHGTQTRYKPVGARRNAS
jgi:ethanolamine utilization protein EutA (predicted chaperonin)